ncbi:MarR family winged helix-turn-helix transcriptional regulator [Falsirhodobacter sp. 20TX0035]|uniref:MarR family winged helix-turn-helix transcriptional regulator n=1 Tax=Falsirhodobacter sp. 20TX0035 TaxID=3022019 RepID=UPI00232B79EF|nr:MarR family transcriptional regulator [Falsirhodobacter sp. 20TX0035]MDB6454524.1 MarR family transcriptional regulator [Falsirhodobacter sp. 20TX0035]
MASTPSDFMERLAAVTRLMALRFEMHAQELGLSMARARLLVRLGREDGQTQTQLAQCLGIAGSSVVALVDGLEKAGFAERRADDSDRRTRRVFLTDLARERAADLERFLAATQADLLKNVPTGDLAAANAVLVRLLANLDHGSKDD